jgi:hypothetical protein
MAGKLVALVVAPFEYGRSVAAMPAVLLAGMHRPAAHAAAHGEGLTTGSAEIVTLRDIRTAVSASQAIDTHDALTFASRECALGN